MLSKPNSFTTENDRHVAEIHGENYSFRAVGTLSETCWRIIVEDLKTGRDIFSFQHPDDVGETTEEVRRQLWFALDMAKNRVQNEQTKREQRTVAVLYHDDGSYHDVVSQRYDTGLATSYIYVVRFFEENGVHYINHDQKFDFKEDALECLRRIS